MVAGSNPVAVTKGSPGSFPEAVARWFSVKEILLRISQNSQKIPSLDSLFNRVTENPRATADNILVAGEKFVEQRHLSNFQKQPHQKWSVKKSVLENFTKFTGKHVLQLY